MRLVNTRDPRNRATFREAIQCGMAPGGGLWVPEPVPCFRDVEALLAMGFQARSAEILHRFLGDEFSRAEVEEAVGSALDFPVPVVRVREGVHALELFHGPTLAFKDFGARFLARMLALAARGDGRRRTVLTATSGDTGAAVASAFLGLPGFQVVVLYPAGRVSPLQERQFATLGDNVRTFAVEGSFDDCQALVKGAFGDADLAARLGLTSANSINIARLLAQVTYYFEAVARTGEAPVIAVPSGNFGNLYAGLLAKRVGLPVKAFVVATNANRTVPDFLETGVYRPRASVATLSNAMDVGAPSNWERIHALFQGDLEAMRGALRRGSLTDAGTLDSMRELHGAGYLPDPHAAVAHGVLAGNLRPGETGVFLATAHPAKFRETLEAELGIRVPLPPALLEVRDRPVLSRSLPADAAALRAELL
ncbi:threonine synthase [Mesoterricola silvestris]|uniref:Threonine synthase n=1 Tax=Mesoterricola silvestris TaxID=2927979 RepID=A0AA48GJN1_9BACT|nr:threonine synthase [Mesoterricola silvestris]BDU74231.1 threonine synthase [Mesoterricola silvestris]